MGGERSSEMIRFVCQQKTFGLNIINILQGVFKLQSAFSQVIRAV
jgi:hypothetical protein